ncbi:hypothetical protein [Bifidobacterium vansinderenii]|uniref:Uncharacterized protein n=1 Tax=Bifidobacterium vansinderenii TaxID=1984871 RepID=A0A229VYC9_9BIFI|nr:hypothetical protein [Bifidobacterium vansinderenii]OXN00624.1 hypothetical protein Tam10B_1147 [Bifidobacterium vansinderenii]
MYDNYFSLFTVDSQLADAYTIDGHVARYHGIDVRLDTADTFTLLRDGRPIGHGYDNGVAIVATIDGRDMRADGIDQIIDAASR